MGNTHHEKYRSNFIWYLLDPKESHDCDGFFLKRFIDQIKKRTADNPEYKGLFSALNTLENEESEILNASVTGEKIIKNNRRIDILIESQNRRDWTIFIENKFESQEGENQMKDYFDYCCESYQTRNKALAADTVLIRHGHPSGDRVNISNVLLASAVVD